MGDRIATLASLSLTPLALQRVHAVRPASAQVDVEGTAIIFASAPLARMPADLPELGRLLGELGVVRLHYHHIHLLPRAILDLPELAQLPYDCTLHDYFPICPQYHLVTAEGRYCGEPAAAGCAACLAQRPHRWKLDIVAWRALFHGFLGERLEDWRSARLMVRRIAENFHLPYFTISPTFTICPVHGYIQGEHFTCPHHDKAA